MQLLSKFWKAKAVSVLLALATTFGGWVTLAWPNPTATSSSVVDQAEVAGALQYLAAVNAARDAAAMPPPDVRRVMVVTRPMPAEEIVVVVGADGQLPIDVAPIAAPEQVPVPVAPASPRQPPPPPTRVPAPSAPPAPAPEPKKQPAPAPTVSKGS